MRGSAALRTGVTPGGALAGPWVRNALWTRARAVPSLDLCFADTKSLVCGTTGQNLVTFTRASSGTFVGSNGVLRNAVTNLLLRSEEFENASWQKNAVTVSANVAINPSGIQTADKIEETAVTNFFSVIQNPTGAFSTTYTWSCYAKASERNFLAINFSISGAIGTWNLTTGVNNITGGTATAVFVGNGWWRLSVTFTTPASGANILYHIFGPCLNNSPINYAGTAGSGIFLWGAQLEQSAAVGEYIPTTSAINSAPRFDHNPTTGESLGLLVEEARTNLVLRSEAIATSPWFGGANTTLTNNTGEVLDPAGGSTATKVVVSGGTGAFGQGATLTAVVHSGSIWLRCATGTISASLIVYLAGSPFTNIGTTNVTITTSWQRFSVVTSTATAAAYNLQLNTIAVGTVYAWGAQLEAGAFPTSYIPTTTATVTRAADVASITGSNFSSWYNQTEGTVFAEFGPYGNGGATKNPGIVQIDSGSAANTIRMFCGGTVFPVFAVDTSSVNQVYISTGTLTPSATSKISGAYKVNDFARAVNGSNLGTDSSGTVPTLSQMLLGTGSAGVTELNGTIKRLTFWPTRLGGEVLQRITQ